MREITTPLTSPLSGWRKPKPTAEAKPKPVKEKFDDPIVHELLAYLRDAIGADLDGYYGTNYAACQELVRRCKAKGNDPIEVIKALVDVATQDPFHGKNATSFRYLLNHAVNIFRTHKQRFAKPKGLDSALRVAEERFARQRADAEADPRSRS